MRKFLLAIGAAAALMLGGCGGGDDGTNGGGNGGGTGGGGSTTEVALADVVGAWHLSSWKGSSVDTKVFDVYLVLDAAKTFKIYQHIQDNGYSLASGMFTLSKNVLSGTYADATAWANTYTVALDTAKNTLTLTVASSSDVSIYKREAVPAAVVADALAPTATSRMTEVAPIRFL